MSQTEVLMPSMGEGVNEATLIRWLKQKGDQVEQDEPLLEVSTDKVDTEIPAPADGVVLELHAQEGDTINVDQLLATIGEAGAKVPEATEPAPAAKSKPAAPKLAASQQPSAAKAPQPQSPPSDLAGAAAQGAVRSSPLVRRMAKDQGIDLQQVTGSGMNGRVTKRDLEGFIKDHTRGTATIKAPGSDRRPQVTAEGANLPVAVTAASGAVAEETPAVGRLATTFVGDQEFLDGVAVDREKMSHMRKLIAGHMVESVRVSPHVTTVFEVDMQRVAQIREGHKKAFQAREGFNLTYTHFLVHAAIQAIKKHPIVNTSIDGDEILFKKDINVGCAVAIESGLIVPVIKQAGSLNLVGVARALNDLVVRAKTKKLKPDDVRGGTFSITNPGGFGSITSNPIINQPQVAILGIGAIIKKPVVVNDAIAIRPQMMISLTFDHRVIDGEGGARYLADLKAILESYDEVPV